MPEPLEYNPSMGSMESHVALMKQRVDSAKEDYDRAVAKGISPAQIENTRKIWEAAQGEYEQFLTGNSSEEDKKEEVAA